MELDSWGGDLGGDIHFRQTWQPQPFPAPDPPGTLDVRHSTVDDVVDALNRMGVSNQWVVAQHLRAAATQGRGHEEVGEILADLRLESCNRSFRNLVIGRLAEDLFFEECLRPLEAQGFRINDYRQVYENRDFGIAKDGVELPINVKVVGTKFLAAKQYVGLDPDDCIPVSSYKAIGAADPDLGRVPDLVFAHLVEFGLRGKVDGYMADVRGPEQQVWQLLSWYTGRGVKQAQDQFIAALFADRGAELRALSDGPGNFRVVSAKKVLSVMDTNKGRVTQLGVRSGSVGADPTIHLSKSQETIAWAALATLLRREGIRGVLRGIRQTASRRASDPSL